MKYFLIELICILLTIQVVCGQEEWVPQKKVTGYIALQGEYFDNLENFDRQYGVSLNEAGLLVQYMPLSKLTFKSVIVYRPELTIDQIINEANFEYKYSDFLKIKVGRFLTPLSPMNTYYYAPVNNSITLPMIISHHEIFPLNVDGISINGILGGEYKIDYDLFGGGFRNTLWSKTGVVGFLGAEQNYFESFNDIAYSVNTNLTNAGLNMCEGAHLGFSFKDILSIGLNVYNAHKGFITVDIPAFDPETGQLIFDDQYNMMMMTTVFDIKKFAYGLNFELNVANVRLLGELWRNEVNFKSDMIGEIDKNVEGAFVEVSRTFNKLTPYLRFEYNNGADTKYNRKTVGLNFKPIFETTFKLEYLRYDYNPSDNLSVDVNGIVGSIIYSF